MSGGCGGVDSCQIEAPDLSIPVDDTFESLLPSDQDQHKFDVADNRRKEDDRALVSAHSHLIKLKSDLQKKQQKIDVAQQAYDSARHTSKENAEKDADDLLLEPTPWNNYFKQLKTFYDREGHSNFKRTIADADVEGMSEEEAKEIRTLSWWTCRQRKFKRRLELEPHKILLLNRLKFNWDPHAGPGPEKWLKNYSLLKEFEQQHGHVKVPVRYSENKLGSWLKTQVTQYRNAQVGKLPALSAERIRLLEEIGINWGEKRVTTPWDERFQTLLDYKRRFRNVNVPWQWKENVALAQWVNSQRKKYKDLLEGKRNNLSEEQINRLNSIGFKWNTGGKGRYSEDNTHDDQNNEEGTGEGAYTLRPDAQNSSTLPPFAASAPMLAPGLATGVTSNLSPEYTAPNVIPSGIAQNEHTTYVGALDVNNGHSAQPVLSGGLNQETLTNYAQLVGQQNQPDLTMLALAYQQLNQQMSSANKLFDQNNGNPFL
mmetsp:Transcript_20583/g.36998  ORF Transcript_20583/g.36998 Transcript_20583/m.36998 type:complete len:485 (-) Transcript_20583:972-2426(-)|eukprot:CAMPEP_0201655972 /NCGR_PEP_ID=MMETSP0493-20130528/46286_1 /ASSEMBLY_ACC=CAM_ASM_000838 /TAXON_ID=420259 /ORGANISM="Thalassiosira gravida, Strain GMp14c1" /LENGTH=484 /DNA_ID=CAMNT_0048132573 /DNA_START=20 /DNA_END=1474 /DNA_ORIENTATION=-